MKYQDGIDMVKAYKLRADASLQRQQEILRRQCQSIIGRPADDIGKALAEMEEMQLGAIPKAEKVGDVWHGGSASVKFGLVYGNVEAKIGFDDGKWVFDTNFWGFGVTGVTAGGGGPWGDGWTSPQGLKMDFEVFTISASGGLLQIFWMYDGKVVGSFVGPAVGAGALGGGGTGTWKKV